MGSLILRFLLPQVLDCLLTGSDQLLEAAKA